ncbi:MAG: TerB N-terminal domain-containing protein [Clostridia bacterium]|nr:TerB N-terminal domain-containing protein [Clostridia bacterium]
MSAPREEPKAEFVIETRRKNDAESKEKDDFWEIDMLLPKRKAPPRRAPGALDTTEVVLEPTTSGVTASDEGTVADSPLNLNPEEGEVVVRHFVSPVAGGFSDLGTVEAAEPSIFYESDSGLVHRVAVYPWSSRYHYYRDFCTDAARYLSYEPAEDVGYDAPVRFFSYVPQYSQLSREQLDYYFWWRREFRRGSTPKTDDSYLYLYVYELLNTAGYEVPVEDGLRMLYRLFFTYGRENPRLSRLLSEWIIDYSLLHRLPVPEDVRGTSDFHRLYDATLKELYISSKGDGVDGYASLLLRYASAYDYRKSHFYKGKSCDYFDRFLPGALSAVISQYSRGDHLFSKTGMQDSHMVRNAFEQALCSYRIRYRIEVDYASFSRSHEMRYLVSDILKYTENRLRAFLGIKSRLTVYSLPNEVKKCIDRYCDEAFPHKSELNDTRKKTEIPSYERLYDLPKTPLSVAHAAEIERESWETTERLTEAFSDEEDKAALSEPPTSGIERTEDFLYEMTTPSSPFVTEGEDTNAPREDRLASVFGTLYPFVLAAYRADYPAERRFAAEQGRIAELIVDEINELAADALGDILLEESDGGYTVIEDYRSIFE